MKFESLIQGEFFDNHETSMQSEVSEYTFELESPINPIFLGWGLKWMNTNPKVDIWY